jgi:hypothetical protein
MAPPTKTLVAPGKPSPPHQVSAVSLGSLHCVHCKKTGHFCSQICRERSIFECTVGVWHFIGCVIFPSNKYNNGHPCLWQGMLIVLVPMIMYIAKRVIIFDPKFTEKSVVGCVVFPSNEYNNGHPCLWQGLFVVLVPMSFY